jgi:hypothetical protein
MNKTDYTLLLIERLAEIMRDDTMDKAQRDRDLSYIISTAQSLKGKVAA